MGFQDHFSGHAAAYARARPAYPPELFAWLAGVVSQRDTAWDCGTGNGQAACGLAEHFARVIATDPSPQQLSSAVPHPRVEYRLATAEQSGLAAESLDLVTVAQAVHWFDLPAFFAEVTRVLRPGGVCACWCYGLHTITPEVDAVIDRLYHEIVGPFWPPERRLIEERYATIPFPFDELSSPTWEMRQHWPLAALTGYLQTWSAVQRYQAERGSSPLDLIAEDLERAWGAADQARDVVWPLYLRIGRRRGL